MTSDEVKSIWYSLGFRGGNSENDWAVRIKFAKAIEAYLKEKKMSSWLIILTGVIYAYIAGEQAYKGNLGMAICYAGYAFGNVGLYIMAAK